MGPLRQPPNRLTPHESTVRHAIACPAVLLSAGPGCQPGTSVTPAPPASRADSVRALPPGTRRAILERPVEGGRCAIDPNPTGSRTPITVRHVTGSALHGSGGARVTHVVVPPGPAICVTPLQRSDH